MPDWVEDELAGVDRPRPLPPGLRDRLEHSLVGPAAAGSPDVGGPRLEDSVAARLADTLSDPLSPWMDSLDAPRPLPPDTRRRLEKALGTERPRRRLLVGASAAVVVALAGIGTALIESGHGSPATPSSAAGPLVGRSGATHAPRPGTSSSTPAAAPQPGDNASAGGQTSTSAQAPTAGPAAPGSVSDGAAAAAPAGPVVTALDPQQGPVGGGNWLTVSGTGLSGSTQVLFGSAPAHFVVVSPSELRAQAPAHPEGTVDVVVHTPAGTSPAQPADRYTYR